jgi:membrane associated rhomboid family serine protease
MGIYDREYYRREGPGFLASFTERGQACTALIVVNIVAFVVQLLTRDWAFDADGFAYSPFTHALWLDPERVVHGEVWRLLTYSFLHDTGTPWHILFNMLFLWWFGTDVEDLYGPREFLAVYLLSAVLGGVAFTLAWLADPTNGQVCLGASGAVTAVMVLCALHYPSRIILLFFFLPVPIWAFVIFQVAQDLFGFVSRTAGHTAVTVHLGGAAFGFLYYKFQWRLLSFWPGLRWWARQRSRPRLRVYHEDASTPPMPVPVPPEADVDEQLEAKLDAVLEKVARSGQGSLTEGERQVLLRASEAYKKRRT